MDNSQNYFIPKFIISFVRKAQGGNDFETDDDSVIKVSSAVKGVAKAYEKLRTMLEDKEEHLLLKNTLLRILKRKVLVERTRGGIGRELIVELILAGYLPNNKVAESQAHKVDQILSKYFTLLEKSGFYQLTNIGRNKLFNWFLGLAACEVEEALTFSPKELLLREGMEKVVERDMDIDDLGIHESEKKIYFFVGVLRSLFKYDEGLLHYAILKIYYPAWFVAHGPEAEPGAIDDFLADAPIIKSKIESILKNPLNRRFYRVCRKYAIYFSVLKEIVYNHQENIEEIISHPSRLEEEVKQVCGARYKKIRRRLVSSIIRSIIYIFVTKMVLVLLLEMPIDYLLQGQVRYLTLGINVAFPPILMFIVGMVNRLPGSENTKKVVDGVFGIVYQSKNDSAKKYHLGRKRAANAFIFALAVIIYLVTYAISFGVLIYVLQWLHFNIVNGLVFAFFLCVVSFFGVRIRGTAKEMQVEDRGDKFFGTLFDFFFLPFIRMGRMLSTKLSKINVFVFFLDFVFEAPFKLILEVFEVWLNFVREKKEELY